MAALTTTDVARRPLPGTVVPTSIRFCPDGSTLTFLLAEAGSLEQRLVAIDVATGERRTLPTPGVVVAEDDLPLEAKLRRERARELAVGVTRYQWAASADRLLVPMADGLWVQDGVEGEPRRIVDAEPGHPLLDARLSDDGRVVGFVRDDEVHVVVVDDHDGDRGGVGGHGLSVQHGGAGPKTRTCHHRARPGRRGRTIGRCPSR